MKIEVYIKSCQLRVERVLRQQLKEVSAAKFSNSQLLNEAMSYAVLNGGKRMRPVLAYASAEAVTGYFDCADIPACAMEFMHTYSLIHDDLPAMDDDALRRGRPTCHIVFGEAMAILAGDALQSLAFELLIKSKQLSVGDRTRLKMLAKLSQASGQQGMVAGQAIDITASGTCLSETQLANMHQLKTGALISASVSLGALSTGVARREQLALLDEYSNCIGLAFQIQDDILDVESDTRTLGKQQGQDARMNKPTYTSMLGVDGARNKAQSLCDRGIAALDEFGPKAMALIEIANYVIRRKY